MLVYRICLAKYADGLFASGYRARWNFKDQFVIYCASSRALACLENVVHRSGEGLNDQFRVLVIDVPDDLLVEEIPLAQLPPDWTKASRYGLCQPLGSAWYEARRSAVLRVPSSIVPQESNFLLHSRHPDFGRIRIVTQEPFSFDARIKASDAGAA
ncbi:RES family NAD+ phosphorylase [Hymenobacter busanensis]|uniref:RES family NAD+ phosphorylase n=1 Tax=Hymenobacter busanensis TaxID=2607656 RepID=A0A7L4ZTW1_9BACT|nr:RES family NAD+ phosphorylase [Hymenobacter busanensis]KAA9339830.1 RES family NAD+ phosphorylase [Hymenobacter busanensis]QHJ06417.1 RES domain-containing protein [Hymenobacter busanensis]